jgi:hypothetical protein
MLRKIEINNPREYLTLLEAARQGCEESRKAIDPALRWHIGDMVYQEHLRMLLENTSLVSETYTVDDDPAEMIKFLSVKAEMGNFEARRQLVELLGSVMHNPKFQNELRRVGLEYESPVKRLAIRIAEFFRKS